MPVGLAQRLAGTHFRFLFLILIFRCRLILPILWTIYEENSGNFQRGSIISTESKPMSAPTLPPRRILVVDDEPFVCDAVKMMLTFDGHIVETASNGKDALEMFAKGKFDLVITDFAMPNMKGDELAATIKARAPG